MNRTGTSPGERPEALEVAELRRENSALAEQVKQLIKVESKLYEYQGELDAQLREYKELYELNRKVSATFDVNKIFGYAIEYVIQKLEYEKVLILERFSNAGAYSVCAAEGYYDQAERSAVAPLSIPQDAREIAPLMNGEEYLICNATPGADDPRRLRARLFMDEYLVYPLGSRSRPHALLAVGNSAARAELHRRVSGGEEALLGVGNLVGLLSSAIENHVLYADMERALQQEKRAEAKYRGIFENSIDGIFQSTSAGRFVNCNPATANILGYDNPEELIRSVTDIGRQLYVYPQRRGELLAMVRKTGSVKSYEVELYRKDGSRQWVMLNVRAIRYENGELLGLDGNMQDITESKRTRDELERARQELESRVQERTAELAHTNAMLMNEIAERKRVEEKLRELSEVDSLTMIYNRRKFFEILGAEVEKVRRYGRPLSLIMFDLDHFKRVNDRYGHGVGDLVLKTTASVVGGVIRKVDVFARHGGDEFLVLCPEVGQEGAAVLAEKIRSTIEQHTYPEVGKVTVSAGVSEFDGEDSGVSLIEKSDGALYLAKKRGRNRVETVGPQDKARRIDILDGKSIH
jgi:diguanylate cyclase (GGDEF)-like protein/PAS domain S-box-containing protein